MGINQYIRDERAGNLPEDQETPYTRLDVIVRRYADGFDLDDNDTCYTPTDFERDLIVHAIHGLICQEDFMETIIAARAMTHEARKAEGQHPCCGAGLDHPHYGVCVNSSAASQRERTDGAV